MKIPFNLHDAIDGKPVINGKGEDFEFEAYYPKWDYPVTGHTVGHTGNIQGSFAKNGRASKHEISDLDLFMKPEKVTRWICVRECIGVNTKQAAIDIVKTSNDEYNSSDNTIAIIKIEFYPGEGLE